MEKKLTFTELLMMGLGSIIGPSIFVILGYAVSIAYSWVFISFIISGLVFLIISFNYAELSAVFPTIGGSYYYSRETYGGILAYVNGITLWFAYIAYGALSALGFGYIISYVTGINPIILAVVALCVFSIVNLIGVKESAKIQLFLTILLLSTFCILIIGSILSPLKSINNILSAPFPSLNRLLKASVFLSVDYVGFDVICVMAGKAENPERTLPRALLSAIIISIIIYSSVAFSAVLILPWLSLSRSSAPLSLVAERIFGFPGLILMTFSGALATLTTLNSAVATSSYILYAMSRDEYLPDVFKKTYLKYRTPLFSILFSAISILLLVISGVIDLVAYIADFGIFVSLALVCFGVILLRKKREIVRIFKVPIYPHLPIIATLICIIFALLTEPIALILWLGLIFVTSLSYLLNLISIERRRCIISGLMFGESLMLIIISDVFRLRIKWNFPKLLAIIVRNYLIIEGIFALIDGILIITSPIIFIHLLIRSKTKELISVPSKKIITVSRYFDKLMAVILIFFVMSNVLAFYAFYYRIIEVTSLTENEIVFFSAFFNLVIIMASVANIFGATSLLSKKYVEI